MQNWSDAKAEDLFLEGLIRPSTYRVYLVMRKESKPLTITEIQDEFSWRGLSIEDPTMRRALRELQDHHMIKKFDRKFMTVRGRHGLD